MKKLLLLLIVPFLIPDIMFAQLVASDYYPLHVGDYWIQHTDTIFGGYQPTTFRTDIEDIDIIGVEEYFRMKQAQTVDDGSGKSSHWYMWVRFDSTGFVIGAFGDTSIVDLAQIYNTPLPSFPNAALNLGYSWEYDFPGTGIGDQHWDNLVESISETVVTPYGIFNDCVKVEIVITDTLGNTVQTGDLYYAKDVGQVLNDGWSTWANNFKFELTEYHVQSTVDVKSSPSVPILFSLHQNYPNPFNPETTIRFELPQAEDVTINIYNLQGQLVRELVSENREAGLHNIVWDAREDAGRIMPSGVYLYRIQAGGFSQVKKLMLLR